MRERGGVGSLCICLCVKTHIVEKSFIASILWKRLLKRIFCQQQTLAEKDHRAQDAQKTAGVANSLLLLSHLGSRSRSDERHSGGERLVDDGAEEFRRHTQGYASVLLGQLSSHHQHKHDRWVTFLYADHYSGPGICL